MGGERIREMALLVDDGVSDSYRLHVASVLEQLVELRLGNFPPEPSSFVFELTSLRTCVSHQTLL